jgi:2-keto-4-pentenoate hydratase
MTADALAAFITEHRQARRTVDAFPADIAPKTEADGARAALAQIDRVPAGWKLGGTNAHTRNVFSVERAYFGPLKAAEIAEGDGSQVSLAGLIAPKVEPEICVAFTADLDPHVHGGDIGALRGLLDHVALGLEIPDTILANPPEAGVWSLVADRCAAGALVLGERLPASVLEELEGLPAVMTAADGEISEGHGDWMIGGALAGVSETLESLRGIVNRIPAGAVIATGGLARAKPFTSGVSTFTAGRYSVRAEAI